MTSGKHSRVVPIFVALVVTIGVTSQVPLNASIPQTFWSPPTTIGVRTQACDTAFTHQETLRISPGQNLILSLTPPSGVSLTSATLHYRFDEGTNQSIVDSVAPISTTFTLPGSSLSEGTTVDYSFSSAFSALSGPCLGAGVAVLPEQYGFHSVATVKTAWQDSPLWESRGYAVAVMNGQPRFSSETSPLAACNTYFMSPTPCAQANGTVDVVGGAPSLPIGEIFEFAVADAQGIPPGYDQHCDINAPENWDAYLYNHTLTTSGTNFVRGTIDQNSESATGKLRLKTFLGGVGFSGGVLEKRVETGFLVSFAPADGQNPSSFPATVNLSWWQKGQRSASATVGPPFQSASGTPASSMRKVRGTVSNNGTRLTESVGGVHASFGTNGASVGSGPSSDGLGTGPWPYEGAKEIKSPPKVTWDLTMRDGTRYGFWIRVDNTITVSTQAGGANAQIDNFDSGNDWFIWAKDIRITANDDVTYFVDC